MNRNDKLVDSNYRAFVKAKPCLVCLRSNVDFAHMKARGWGNGKQNDYTGLPLCRLHHAEQEQIGYEKFQFKYQVNVWEEVAWQLIEWLRRKENVLD